MHKGRLIPSAFIVLFDILLAGTVLLLFALFHHVLPTRLGGVQQSIVILRDTPSPIAPAATRTPTAQTSAAKIPVSTPTPEPSYGPGDFTRTFPTDPLPDDAIFSYADEGIRVAITMHQSDKLTYYVADLWVRKIESFTTFFAMGEFARGSKYYRALPAAAKNEGILLGISGDSCTMRTTGVVIRNGNLYRKTESNEDVCILYSDGVMETYPAKEFDLEAAIARGAYQSWCFGPVLISDGMVSASFNCSDAMYKQNPRSAIGYYEPGHITALLPSTDGRATIQWGSLCRT